MKQTKKTTKVLSAALKCIIMLAVVFALLPDTVLTAKAMDHTVYVSTQAEFVEAMNYEKAFEEDDGFNIILKNDIVLTQWTKNYSTKIVDLNGYMLEIGDNGGIGFSHVASVTFKNGLIYSNNVIPENYYDYNTAAPISASNPEGTGSVTVIFDNVVVEATGYANITNNIQEVKIISGIFKNREYTTTPFYGVSTLTYDDYSVSSVDYGADTLKVTNFVRATSMHILQKGYTGLGLESDYAEITDINSWIVSNSESILTGNLTNLTVIKSFSDDQYVTYCTSAPNPNANGKRKRVEKDRDTIVDEINSNNTAVYFYGYPSFSYITPIDSATASASGFIYDAKEHIPEVVMNKKTLVSGTDYEVISVEKQDGTAWSSTNTCDGVGNYRMTIKGINDYKGTKTFNWSIEKLSISVNDITYGSSLDIGVAGPTDLVKKTTYYYATDPSGPWETTEPTDCGSYYVKAVFIGKDNKEYTDDRTVMNMTPLSFSIDHYTLTAANFGARSFNFFYRAGTEWNATPSLNIGGRTLKSGVDYDISGTVRATDAGDYTYTITPKGNCIGDSFSGSWKIWKADWNQEEAVKQLPTAGTETLEYNEGTTYDLIIPGETNFGVFEYCVYTVGGEYANQGEWSTEIPKASKTGEYEISYRIKSTDPNYNDINFSETISKVIMPEHVEFDIVFPEDSLVEINDKTKAKIEIDQSASTEKSFTFTVVSEAPFNSDMLFFGIGSGSSFWIYPYTRFADLAETGTMFCETKNVEFGELVQKDGKYSMQVTYTFNSKNKTGEFDCNLTFKIYRYAKDAQNAGIPLDPESDDGVIKTYKLSVEVINDVPPIEYNFYTDIETDEEGVVDTITLYADKTNGGNKGYKYTFTVYSVNDFFAGHFIESNKNKVGTSPENLNNLQTFITVDSEQFDDGTYGPAGLSDKRSEVGEDGIYSMDCALCINAISAYGGDAYVILTIGDNTYKFKVIIKDKIHRIEHHESNYDCVYGGTIEHWVDLDDNNKIYADEELTQEITETYGQGGGEHDWDEELVEYTDDMGNKTYVHKCKKCSSTQSHMYSDYYETIDSEEATCKKDGHKAYEHCKICDKYYINEWDDETYTSIKSEVSQEDVIIPKRGHTPGEWSVTKEPTCTEKGERYQYCSDCNATLCFEQIRPKGHTLEHFNGVKPTYEMNGENESWHCTVCNKIFADETCLIEADYENHRENYEKYLYIPPLVRHDHNADTLVLVEAKAATCTEDGNTVYYQCSVCDECFTDVNGVNPINMEDTVIKAAHTPAAAVNENEVSATCEAAGSYDEVIKCSVCGEEISRTHKTIEALGHDWGEWTVKTPATETTEGMEERVCKTDASHKETRAIPILSHKHVLVKVEAKAATCTETGNIEYWTCEGCNKLFADKDGKTEINSEDTVKTKIAHTPAASTKENEVKATCEKDGSYEEVVKCSICGEEISRKTVTVHATGHDFGDWETKKNPTETSEGLEERVCKNDASHKETRTIPKLEAKPVTDDKSSTGDNTTPATTEAPKTSETPAAKNTTLTDESTKATFTVTSSAGEEPTVEYKASADVTDKTVTVPDSVTIDGVAYKVTEIADNAFANNKTVEKVVISSNVETIGDGAFSGCTKLKSVSIPANVTDIGDKAFKGCTSLTSIKTGNGVKEIGDSAFEGCKKLKRVTIGSKVTEIGDNAFANCPSLTKVTLPAKVTKIGKNAFKGDKKLKTITIKSTKLTEKSISKNAFKGVGNKVTIKVPKKMKAKYTKLFRKKGLSKKVKIK